LKCSRSSDVMSGCAGGEADAACWLACHRDFLHRFLVSRLRSWCMPCRRGSGAQLVALKAGQQWIFSLERLPSGPRSRQLECRTDLLFLRFKCMIAHANSLTDHWPAGVTGTRRASRRATSRGAGPSAPGPWRRRRPRRWSSRTRRRMHGAFQSRCNRQYQAAAKGGYP